MSYERKLQALGRLLDRRVVRDICMTEIPGGVIVTGLARTEEQNVELWRPISFEVADEDLGAAPPKSAASERPRRLWPF